MRKYLVILVLALGVVVLPGRVLAFNPNEGMLIKGTGPRVYVVEYGQRRWIKTMEDFIVLGYSAKKIKVISNKELITYPQGEAVTKDSGYPDHTLLKGSGRNIFIIIKGKKSLVRTPSTLVAARLSLDRVINVSDKKLIEISETTPVDGNLPVPPRTTITGGPVDDVALESATQTFRYIGLDAHGSQIVKFQTKVDGLDNNWQNMDATTERTVTANEEQASYVFFVRSVDRNGVVDDQPAYRRFTIRRGQPVGQVKIENINRSSSDPSQEYITLRVISKTPVNLMGWRIGNTDGNSYSIGTMQTVYSASSVMAEEPSMPYDSKIVIVTGRNPITYNFRVNRCLGFLETAIKFVPGIGYDCPRPALTALNSLTRVCHRYIDGLSSCRPPQNLSDKEQKRIGSTCVEFSATHFNYEGCVTDHSAEPNFLTNEWRFYLNANQSLWSDDGGTAVLRDSGNQIIDTKAY